MSNYTYIIGKGNTLHLASSATTHSLIGNFILQSDSTEHNNTAMFIPNIGNAKLVFNQSDFFTMLNTSAPLDTFFDQAQNYKLVNSVTKTVLTTGLLTIPCPYVDHSNIFPSIQELVDVYLRKINAEFYVIIPLEEEQYKIYIYERV